MRYRAQASAACFALAAALSLEALAVVPDPLEDPEPRWMVEPRAGRFEPQLEDYERFYGSPRRRHAGIAFAYRFRPWLEAGAEIAYSRDQGVGTLPSGELAGEVEFTLVPAHAFVNLRWERSPVPLVVPYLGAGVAVSYYRQRIDLQPTRRGRTDLGTSLRAGVQLSLDRLDPQPDPGSGVLKRTFLFIEAQRIDNEIEDVDLGGNYYVLGMRFEFGRRARR